VPNDREVRKRNVRQNVKHLAFTMAVMQYLPRWKQETMTILDKRKGKESDSLPRTIIG
jgi:hypothetical protein